MTLKQKIKKDIFDGNYIYSSIINRLLTNGKLDCYINYMENNKNDITYLKKNIPQYKNFLTILDNFICYLDYNLNINHLEMYNIIEILLKDNPKFLLTNKCIMNNDSIEYFINCYNEIIIIPFIANLTFVNIKYRIVDKYKIDINDINRIFELLADFCYIRKNHQIIFFDDFNNYINNKNENFYLFLWKVVIDKLDKYYELLEYINN